MTTFGDLARDDPALNEPGVAYDHGLPLDWCEDVLRVTGTWPEGFVWRYAPRSYLGGPHPLTDDARALLDLYAKRGPSHP